MRYSFFNFKAARSLEEKMDEKEFPEETVVTTLADLSSEKKKKKSHLVFLSGPLVGRTYPLREGKMILGRNPDGDISINDPGISRQHIAIITKKGNVSLKDLGSTNGTLVNGKKIAQVKLVDGDRIQISTETIIKFTHQDHLDNKFHKQIYQMTIIDALTGCYNKKYFEERLREEFSYCIRNHIVLSLLMFDVDHFKKINDTYGHPAGDFVLKKISELSQSVIRNEDVLARYGGEEFCILLKGTSEQGASMLAERLRKLVDDSVFEFENNTIHVTISIGVALLHENHFPDHEALLKRADTLLYESKHKGRNQVSLSFNRPEKS